ncbi:MAG TPA: amino acid adenylation domain-containing protein [Thermoanaerobaculia bacterium]|nr:amino acid adenylation domain-containing protein [Thermoanaerobaculia bacterium]
MEWLRAYGAQSPDREVYRFLAATGEEAGSLTVGELDEAARRLGARLQALGVTGGRALLLYPAGVEFIAAFFGCLYGGWIAVPAFPPARGRSSPRLLAIAADARPEAVLTTAALAGQVRAWAAAVPGLAGVPVLATGAADPGEEGGAAGAADWRDPGIAAQTPAFLQYTSGSTSLPKGVVVTHGNLLHNEEVIRRAFAQTESSVIVSWLPLYHDMGLIGGVLQPLYTGAVCVLLSPLSFLQRPRCWLEAISRYRATTSGGPNFAYELCVRRVGERERSGLDLSSWRVAFTGSETVRPATLARFAEAFAGCGFERRSFLPCYGLAESTLFVAGAHVEAEPVVATFDAAALGRGWAAAPRAEGARVALTGCGAAGMDLEVVIAEPEERRRCPPGRVGEIWVAGPSVAQGYWNRPEESAQTFAARLADEPEAGPFLRTGDLGFRRGGDLFVTGRRKELIILRGRNCYPQDLEATAQAAHPALVPDGGAAFSVEVADEERLVLAHEVDRRSALAIAADPAGERVEEIARQVRRALAEEHEVSLHALLLLRPGVLPKTSSGKVQRQLCRELYLRDELPILARGEGGPEAEEPTLQGEPGTAAPDPESLARLPPDEALARLAAFLRDQAAAVVRAEAAGLADLADLGVDSLAAAELAQRLERALGVEVSLARILERPGFDALAGEILHELQNGRSRAAAARPRPAAAGQAAREFPLSQGQRALWFLHHLAPGSAAYHLVAAARVAAGLDAAALERACRALAARHPALSTTFHGGQDGGDDEPFQRVEGEAKAPRLAVIDASGWSAAELAAAREREAYRPFDVAAEPLWRVTLLRRPAAAGAWLVMVIHHLVADFASLGVLAAELAALYRAESGGRPAVLAPPALRYSDYVEWERRRLAGPEGERLERYWRERLAGVPEVIELPLDRPRGRVQSFRGTASPLALDAATVEGLRRLGREQGATLFMVLLAAFQALLHRYSGQEDLLVAAAEAGRSDPGLAPVIGYFANPVPFRTGLGGDPGFAHLVDRVRGTALGAFAHLGFPFPLLAERLRVEREPGRLPLAQVLFALHRARSPAEEAVAAFALKQAGPPLDLGGLCLEPVALPERSAAFDLTLTMAEVGGRLAGALQVASDLFDPGTATRMAGHLECLLAAAAAGPELRLSDLPLLAAAETAQVSGEWNDTAAADPEAGAGLHHLFRRQAQRSPDAVAVADGTRALTYAELDRWTGGLAARLRALGCGPDVLVGIALERSLELVVALLATLKAGAAYVPLDLEYPPERLAFMLEDSRPALVLSESGLLARLPAALPRVLCLDLVSGRGGEGGAAEAEAFVDDSQLAYMIYTSGSTGRPKGAMVHHRAIRNRLLWMQAAYRLTPADTVVQKTPFSFDVSVWEFFWPLLTGARLVLARPGGHRDSRYLLELVARERVSVAHFVPAMLQAFLEEPEVERLGGSLRLIVASGEALPERLARLCRGRLPAALENLYGPTEAAVDVTSWSCGPSAAMAPPEVVPIGRPIANTHIRLLDRRLRPVALGAPGELFIGGMNVGRGYFARPDLTAEKFLPEAQGEPGARLYRTGDLARYRPDGAIEYLGRIDHQVKVRGVRIELGEIEAALASHPRVREAVALVLAEEREGAAAPEPRLVAFLVAAAGAPAPGGAELRELLERRLPPPMVPSAFVPVAELPLSPNGKVDRRALARLAPRREHPATAPPAAVSPAAEVLAALMAELLGVPALDPGESFFAHGGHSLLATRLLARVRRIWQVDLPLAALFAAPTPASLAREVERAARGGSGPVLPPLVPVSRQGPLPLSIAQQRLWMIHQMAPESRLYNEEIGLVLSGPLAPAALARGLGVVVERHEALRTTFVLEDGEPVQRIAPAAPVVPLPAVDLGGLAPEVRWRTVAELARAGARRLFDLERGPLLRATLLRLAADEHLLVVHTPHILADGWSLGVFLRDLLAVYRELSGGPAAALQPLPVQYADYAVWQRRCLGPAVLAPQLAYWREQLAAAPAGVTLPADRERPARLGYAGIACDHELPADLAAAVSGLARHQGGTVFMVLLAAFGALLHRYGGQDDLAVGSPFAGRGRPELEDLIGFFVNTLVLRLRPAGGLSGAAFLDQVRATVLGAAAHADVPFERLVEELQTVRDPGRHPLFEVVLALQSFPRPAGADGAAGPLRVRQLDLDADKSHFDLSLFAEPREGGLSLALRCRRDLFHAATARRFLDHFATLLADLAAHPEKPLAALAMLAAGERHQLVHEWNDTRSQVAAARTVPEVFSAQAGRVPGAVAVTDGANALTYRELEERSNQLARFLLTLGMEPEDRIGVPDERSLDGIVSLLAVLKAGGAYVPVDPALPPERASFLYADAGIGLFLDLGRGELPVPAGVRRVGAGELGEIARQSRTRLPPRACPASLAYVMYTSGSTGRPKGVAVTHRGIVRLLLGVSYVELGPRETFLQLAPQSFDASTLEIWGPLLHGGRLVLHGARVPSLDELGEALARHGVTSLWLTAGLLHQMIERNLPGLAPLRQLLAGGDALSPRHVRELLAALPALRLINGYGPTEGTTFSCCQTLGPEPGSGPVPIGRPIADTRAHPLDAGGRPVPIGAPAELHIGGDGLARGYFGRPDLTAERFVPDPLAVEPGGRLYRTGDLVRRRADGRLEFLGRVDLQVKIRGFRVEPGEVEAVLCELPQVAGCAVVPVEGPAGKRLVACLVAAAGSRPEVLESAWLRRALLARLPEPMVPSSFVRLAALPLTANGKVDRRALLALALETSPGREEGSAGGDPRDPVEELLCRLWAELLGRERVATHEDFFALGGHSLLAIQAASRIRQELGVDLPLRQLFDQPTVALLARAVESARRGEPERPEPPLAPVPRGAHLPLSYAQERLWVLHLLDLEGAVLNIAGAVRLDGPLDVPALAAGFAEIRRRHEILCVRFVAEAGRPVQVYAGPSTTPLPLVDLSALAPQRRQHELLRRAGEEASRPFDLGHGELLRTTLVRLAAGEHAVLLTLHHLAGDGASMEILMRELSALYGAGVRRRPSPLPELPVQYADYAEWQRRRLDAERLERQLAYWRRQLAEPLPVLSLPGQRQRPGQPAFRGAAQPVALAPEAAALLAGLGRQSGATLFMVLLAGLAALLHQYTGEADLLIGTNVTHRHRPEVEGLIGFFVNNLVLRVEVAATASFRTLVRQVREVVLDAFAHQDLPFEKLIETLRPQRRGSYAPLFQVMFVLRTFELSAWRLDGLELAPIGLPQRSANFDLILSLTDTREGLEGALIYDRELFDADFIAGMARQLEALLERVGADPDRPLHAVAIAPQAELLPLASNFNEEL